MGDSTSTRSVGNKAEELACKYLQKSGYKIITRNYQIRGGEVDIIARDGEFLVFIEVKARYNHNFGLPEESISFWKIKALQKTAQVYINFIKWGEKPYRFDFLGIDYTDSFNSPKINLIKNII